MLQEKPIHCVMPCYVREGAVYDFCLWYSSCLLSEGLIIPQCIRFSWSFPLRAHMPVKINTYVVSIHSKGPHTH